MAGHFTFLSATRRTLDASPASRAWPAFVLVAGLLALSCPGSGRAQEAPILANLSLEQLSEITITTASKRPESLATATAAVSVLTGEEIHRQGAISIPEALRLAPGMQVARIDSQTWAISPRGLAFQFSNKFLVLMDGRSVYSPMTSGVYWDVQSTLLDDLDRIEVIRGPGGTIWGANAVNGVINIITKSAHDTPGLLVNLSHGTNDQYLAEVRYGGKLSKTADYRVYFQKSARDALPRPDGSAGDEEWGLTQGGFRADWSLASDSQFTLQADAYDRTGRQLVTLPTAAAPYMATQLVSAAAYGGNVLGRLTRQYSSESALTIQAYYDYSLRHQYGAEYRTNTFDLDAHYHFPLGDRHAINWGLGYRLMRNEVPVNFNIRFSPPSRQLDLFQVFLQDEITLVPEHWKLTVGAKAEHNVYTAWELQPSVRLLWTPGGRQTVWAAVSRAVHTPDRVDDLTFYTNALAPGTLGPGTPVVYNPFASDGRPESETLVAYELGWRKSFHDRLNLDVTGFFNQYDKLTSTRAGPLNVSAGTYWLLPLYQGHFLKGETYGGEATVQWQATAAWRFQATYSHLKVLMHSIVAGVSEIPLGSTPHTEDGSPEHQFLLRASFDAGRAWQLDGTVRYVSDIRRQQVAVPDYLTADVRVAWHPDPQWEISVTGQNLLEPRHIEFNALLLGHLSAVPRSVYGKVTWKY